MNIAFEISPLLLASGSFGDKSGVYRYHYGLIKAYGEYFKKNKINDKIVLFSFNRDLISFPLTRDIYKLLDNPAFKIINQLPSNNRTMNYYSNIFKIFIKPFLKVINKVFSFKKLYYFLISDFYFKKYIKSLKIELKKYQVNIIFHSETSFYPLRGFKNVITVYDLTPIIFPFFHREETRDLTQRKLNFTTRHCQGIVCISEATKKDLLTQYPGNNHKKITICYPGLDPVFSKDIYHSKLFEDLQIIAQQQVTELKKRRYLLYYGTFEPRKNLSNLVESFVELQKEKQIPNDFKLVLMGGDGWGKIKKGIINYVKENFPNKKKNNIIIFDFLNDIYLIALIKNAYAFTYPSFYEGFGLPVLESMSLDTPVICSNTSSLPEVGGDSVIYINPHDYYDLKEKIKFLINHPTAAKKLGVQGKMQSSKFNWEKSSRQLYNFLQNM